MRARHRHFSCKSAGASLVLDSRYISGLSNNDLVNTWPDQSGNGYSPTSSSTPIFKTREQGGNPVVSFDGNKFLYFNANLSNTNGLSIIAVAKYKSTTAREQIFDAKNYGSFYSHFMLEVNTYASQGDHYDFYSSGAAYEGSIPVTTNFVILSVGANTTSGGNIVSNTSYYVNGIINPISFRCCHTGSYNSDLSSLNGFMIGGSNTNGTRNGGFNGDIGAIFVFPYKINTSLLKRLEHASALSFKIPYQ